MVIDSSDPARPPLAAPLTAVGASAPVEVSGTLSQTAAQGGKIGTFARRFLPPGAALDERSRRPRVTGGAGWWRRPFCAPPPTCSAVVIQ